MECLNSCKLPAPLREVFRAVDKFVNLAITDYSTYVSHSDDFKQEIKIHIWKKWEKLKDKDNSYIKKVIRNKLNRLIAIVNAKSLTHPHKINIDKEERNQYKKEEKEQYAQVDLQQLPARKNAMDSIIYRELKLSAAELIAAQEKHVIELWAKVRNGLSVEDAAVQCEISPATAYRILKKLEADITALLNQS